MTDPLFIRITDLLSTAMLGVPGDPLTSTYYDDMTATTDTSITSTPAYDKAWFTTFFTAIPDNRWCTGETNDGNGHCCSYGHLHEAGYRNGDVGVTFQILLQSIGALPACVNDGEDARYQQATPRARILAALNDLP